MSLREWWDYRVALFFRWWNAKCVCCRNARREMFSTICRSCAENCYHHDPTYIPGSGRAA